jgi:hypothetical protein
VSSISEKLNPTTLAKYRQTFSPSGAKDDPTDAELALDLLFNHPHHFKLNRPGFPGDSLV